MEETVAFHGRQELEKLIRNSSKGDGTYEGRTQAEEHQGRQACQMEAVAFLGDLQVLRQLVLTYSNILSSHLGNRVREVEILRVLEVVVVKD